MSKESRQANSMAKKVDSVVMNMMPLGKCQCGSELYHYVKSEPPNVFNAYCLKCKSTSDVRFPKTKDVYYLDKIGTIQEIVKIQKEENETNIDDNMIQNLPISPAVNETHGTENYGIL
jgi:hypothetical protein